MTEAQASKQQWESWILSLAHAIGRLGCESGISFASMHNCHDTTHNSNATVNPELNERGQFPDWPEPGNGWAVRFSPPESMEWNTLFLGTAQGRKVSGRSQFSPLQYSLREASLSGSENCVSQCWTADAHALWVLLAWFTGSQEGMPGKEHLKISGQIQPLANMFFFFTPLRFIKTHTQKKWQRSQVVQNIYLAFYRVSLLTPEPKPFTSQMRKVTC